MTTDKTVPGEKWEFNEDVAECFEDMLRRSIPQYDVMRKACFDIGKRFIEASHKRQRGRDVVDLGCSRGDAIREFVKAYGIHNRYVGVEISEPMRLAASQLFAGAIESAIVEIRSDDLREAYPPVSACLTLSVLTLQFIPIEYRAALVKRIHDSTVDGGALVVVEKVLGATSDLNQLEVDLYYEMKEANGYERQDIDRKRHSLEGVLVPVTAKWNEEILEKAGFSQVECFWRWMNFAGWIAVKKSR